jgi:RND family efflux transporter MFP subunit
MTGGDVIVSTPSAGRFSGAVPEVGTHVVEGQPLGRLEPRLEGLEDVTSLEADVSKKRLEVVETRNELARADLLVTARAVPARRLETARHALDNARADLRAAEARLESRLETLAHGGSDAGRNAFVLRAPITGTLVRVDATPGAAYDAGAALFRIVRTDRVVVEAQIPEAEARQIARVTQIAIDAGAAEPVSLTPRSVRRAGVIDLETRAMPVWFDVDNRGGQLLVNQSVTVLLHTGEPRQTLAVPASALLTDGGQTVAFVQTGGETFERRVVQTGERDGTFVAVRQGLHAGDRVVTRGAYEVLLAAALPAQPAGGHVH